MLFVFWVPIIFQLLVPLAVLAWLGYGRPSSRSSWVVRVVLAGFYLVAIGIGGLWLILPWYMPVMYGGLLLCALAYSFRRVRRLPAPPPDWPGVAALALTSLAALFFAGLTGYLMSGWQMPRNIVELSFPFRDGTYLVVNAGGNKLINGHLNTLEGERSRPWRGQSYGVDIEKLNPLGLRAWGISPKNLAAYAIFGEPLYAPCSGAVIVAQDGIEEMIPPTRDQQHLAGNHVILACTDAWILLGHLQKGSVRVRRGDRIAMGQPIGRVGNSGNSDEPHLHIHAQRPGTAAAPLSGEPLWISFGDKYPVRNQRIKAPST